jgi:hypothetical protein
MTGDEDRLPSVRCQQQIEASRGEFGDWLCAVSISVLPRELFISWMCNSNSSLSSNGENCEGYLLSAWKPLAEPVPRPFITFCFRRDGSVGRETWRQCVEQTVDCLVTITLMVCWPRAYLPWCLIYVPGSVLHNLGTHTRTGSADRGGDQ